MRAFFLAICFLAFCFGATLSGVALAHPPPIVSGEQEKGFADEIIAFAQTMTDAVVAKDIERLRLFYAPSFVHTDDAGKIHDRDARMAAVVAGDADVTTAQLIDRVVRVPGGWTAVVTGRSDFKSKIGVLHRYAWTAVYVRTERSWALAASHATRLGAVSP
jgi:ketosteroid isomerase-like protein